MALEDIEGAGKYIDALQPANPASFDDRREGDNHIRGVKNTIRNTFPNITGPVTATQGQINDAVAGSFENITAENITASASLHSAGTLRVDGAVSGAGMAAYMASPPTIGGVTPGLAAFTYVTTAGMNSTQPVVSINFECRWNQDIYNYFRATQDNAPRWANYFAAGGSKDFGWIRTDPNTGAYLDTPMYFSYADGAVRIAGNRGALLTSQSGSAPSFCARAWGRVASNAAVSQGEGFTCAKSGTGKYTITLNGGVSQGAAAIVATLEDSAGNTGSIMTQAISATQYLVTTVSSASSPADRPFFFIVVG